MVFYLAYVSSASALFSEGELTDILRTSRERNTTSGVTGALLYQDGNLMQVLEGEESVVRQLYSSISRDRRHTGLITVLEGHQDQRQFEDWSMAYRDFGGDGWVESDDQGGFVQARSTAAELGADPRLCRRLLNSFRRTLKPPRIR